MTLRFMNRGSIGAIFTALAVLVAVWKIWAADHVFFWLQISNSDFLETYVPYRKLLQEAALQGQLPVWCPSVGGGWPLFGAFEAGALFPLNWIGLSLEPTRAISLTLVVVLVLAALCTYALGRTTGLSPLASFVAGVTWPLSGAFVSHVGQVSMVSSVAFAPLALALALESGRRDRYRRILWLGAVLALAFFAGHPQMVHGTVVALGFVGLANFALRTDTRPRADQMAWAGVAAVLTVMMIAPQLAASLPLQARSMRAGNLTVDQCATGALQGQAFLGWLHPALWADPAQLGSSPDPTRDQAWTHAGPGALLAFVLALVALRRDRRVRIPLMAVAAASLMACGTATPVFGWAVRLVPGVALFRFPDRWMFFAELSLAWLTGWALDRWTRGPNKPRRWFRVLVIAAHLGSLVVVSVGRLPMIPARLVPPPCELVDAIRARGPGRVYEMFAQEAWTECYVQARGWSGDLTPYLAFYSTLRSNLGVIYGMSTVQGYMAMSTMEMKFLTDGLVARLLDMEHRSMTISHALTSVLRSTATRYVTSVRPLIGGDLTEVARTHFARDGFQVYLYEVRGWVPEVRLVGQSVAGGPRGRDIVRMREPGHDPAARVVLRDSTADVGTPGPAGRVHQVHSGNLGRIFDVEAHRDGFLVVSTTRDPSWRAWVDGREVETLAADLAYFALRVPAGSHRVILTYEVENWTLWVGMLVTGALLTMGLGLRATRGL